MKDLMLYIWLQRALGLYSRVSRELLSRFDGIRAVYECADFSFLSRGQHAARERLLNKDISECFEIMKRCDAGGIRVVGMFEPDYPEALKKISSPPVALYAIGDFDRLYRTPAVAIVGTRDCTELGKETSENFAYASVKCGASVISGLAKGIDVASHRGAVAAGGFTVGVLGTPIGVVYPRENEKAFETLYKRGLVISEMYPGAPRTRADFPSRNRLISALSDSVVVIEAGERSGSLITARYGTEQGKPVFAVPGALGSQTEGINYLLSHGATLASDPLDVLTPLALVYPSVLSLPAPEECVMPRKRVRAESASAEETVADSSDLKTEQKASCEAPPENLPDDPSLPLGERILRYLRGKKPKCADEICRALSVHVNLVLTELVFLELDDKVVASIGGRYSIC